ncbi:MAG: hypothetical protein WC044_02080 [Crocinitomicaceae bacterium]
MNHLVKNFVLFSIKISGTLFLVVAFIVGGIYLTTRMYDFPPSKPFSGEFFYNPYASCTDKTPTLRANFHAHTVAWGNVTYGHNSDQELYDGYVANGYDIAGISNYHTISSYGKGKSSVYIPIYEHGYNVFKSHCLALKAKEVSYLDYPLFQSTSHQQTIIENIKKTGSLVAVAHPNLVGSRTMEDMKCLVHYDFLEVLNHYRNSDKEWDAALSSGRLSWIIANDDTHDVTDETAMKIWNVIYSNSRNADSILTNMKRGMHYGVKTEQGINNNELVSCQVENDVIRVSFKNPVLHFDVMGQDGKMIDYQYSNRYFEYKIKPTDTYIRFVAKSHKSIIFMNPIVRYDGKNLPLTSQVAPLLNVPKTFIVRGIIALFLLEIVLLFGKLWKPTSKS